MKNNYILVLGIFLMVGLVFVARDSYANPVMEEEIKVLDLELNKNNNQEEFKKELTDYIDLVDNSLIPNTSYNISGRLNENYDFLTKFAISFILDNREYYEIINKDSYEYVDQYGGVFKTSEYIDLDKIYEITDKVFGVDYYYILNDYLEIDNEMISLLEVDNREFAGVIDNIALIDMYDNYMDVVVKYVDSDIDYVYRFDYVDNRYVISNLSIKE